jgi:hypothetical protein
MENQVTKICTKCKLEKSLDLFYNDNSKKSGKKSLCKVCDDNRKKIKRETDPEYRKKENRKRTDRRKRRMAIDPEYRKKENRKRSDRKKRKGEINPEFKTKENKKKYERDKNKFGFTEIKTIRGNLQKAIRNQYYTPTSKLRLILGVDWENFKQYFEGKFSEGMTWDNYGEWVIDHIIPMTFAKNYESILKLNHYTNLQPLWFDDNIKKADNILEEHKELFYKLLGEEFVK